MSAPPDTAGVRTPPLKSLIFKDSGFALSKIYQCGVFRSIEGASRGTPRGGSPTLRAAPPPPPKAPQRGVIRPPEGRGRAAPLSALRAPLRPPWGTPTGFPRLRRLPLLSLFGNGRGQAKRAGAVAPERGWKKIKVVAPIAAARPPAVEMWGRPGSRWAGVGAAGGQPPGLSTGCPCLCPRAAKRRPVAQRSPHLHCPGVQLGPLWGPVLPRRAHDFRSGSLVSTYTCLSSGPPEARF